MDGTRVLVGNTRLLTKFGIEYPDELSSIVDTIVACAIGTKYAGYLLLSDTLKEDAVNAVKELKALNINNIQILSGDKQAIVTKLCRKARHHPGIRRPAAGRKGEAHRGTPQQPCQPNSLCGRRHQ